MCMPASTSAWSADSQRFYCFTDSESSNCSLDIDCHSSCPAPAEECNNQKTGLRSWRLVRLYVVSISLDVCLPLCVAGACLYIIAGVLISKLLLEDSGYSNARTWVLVVTVSIVLLLVASLCVWWLLSTPRRFRARKSAFEKALQPVTEPQSEHAHASTPSTSCVNFNSSPPRPAPCAASCASTRLKPERGRIRPPVHKKFPSSHKRALPPERPAHRMPHEIPRSPTNLPKQIWQPDVVWRQCPALMEPGDAA